MSCDFKECHKVLTESKANILIVNQNLDAKSNILSWVETTSYEEYKQYRDNGLDIEAEFPVEDIPVGLKLDNNTTKEDYNKLQSYIKEGKVGSFSNSQAIEVISKIIPKTVYDDWLSCMNRMIECVENQGYGLHHEVIRNGGEIIIKAWYTPYNPDDKWPKISNEIYAPTGVECKHDCVKKGDNIDREMTFIFSRESGVSGTIAINTDKGSILVPTVPIIDVNNNLDIQEQIKGFIQNILTAKGVRMDRFKFPSNPGTHEDYHEIGEGIIEIENFSANGTILKCQIVMKRVFKGALYVNHIEKNFETGEVKDWWEEDKHESTRTCKINMDIDFSRLDLENVIFCANPKDQLKEAFFIDECCVSGKEFANKIIEWLDK